LMSELTLLLRMACRTLWALTERCRF